MADREVILSQYSQSAMVAADKGQVLTPTEFMLASAPGNNKVVYKGSIYYTEYANADSARRSFRKLQTGETSGRNLLKRSELYTQSTGFSYRGRTLYGRARGKGGREEGLWKVVVHMNWTDSDGRVHEDEQRSFIVRSYQYTNYFDAKAVEFETGDAIEEHIAQWEDEYGVGEIEVVYVEVIRIQTTKKGGPYIVDIE